MEKNELKFAGNVKKISNKLTLIDFDVNLLFRELSSINEKLTLKAFTIFIEALEDMKPPFFSKFKSEKKEKTYYKIKLKLINDNLLTFNDYLEKKETKENNEDYLPF